MPTTLYAVRASSATNAEVCLYNDTENITILLIHIVPLMEYKIEIIKDPGRVKLVPMSPCSSLLVSIKEGNRIIRYQDEEYEIVIPVVKRYDPLPSLLRVQYDENPTGLPDDPIYWHRYLASCLTRLFSGIKQIESSEPRQHTKDKTRGFLTAITTFPNNEQKKWFIKTFSNKEEFENEQENNRVLGIWQQKNSISTLLTASFYFKGKFSAQGPVIYFLGFEFIPHFRIDEVTPDKGFTAGTVALGLVNILEVFALTAPGVGLLTKDMSVVRFWHKDLHVGQIIFSITTKKCYLIDFGNSHLEYVEGHKHSITGSSSSVPRNEEHTAIVGFFKKALNKFDDKEIIATVKALKKQLNNIHLCKHTDLVPLKELLQRTA